MTPRPVTAVLLRDQHGRETVVRLSWSSPTRVGRCWQQIIAGRADADGRPLPLGKLSSRTRLGLVLGRRRAERAALRYLIDNRPWIIAATDSR